MANACAVRTIAGVGAAWYFLITDIVMTTVFAFVAFSTSNGTARLVTGVFAAGFAILTLRTTYLIVKHRSTTRADGPP